MPSKTLAYFSGAATVVVGLIYVLRVYGEMEAEVVIWGQLATLLGLALMGWTLIQQLRESQGIGVSLCLAVAIATLQLPALYLWVVFLGAPISDLSSSSTPVSSIAALVSHATLLTLNIWLIYRLLQRRSRDPKLSTSQK